MEYEPTYVDLIDDEGGEVECELLDRVEYEGGTYVLLMPTDEGDAEPEVIILREENDGRLAGFEDGAVLDAVFELFLQKNNLK